MATEINNGFDSIPENWKYVPNLKTRMENLLETGFESDLTLLLGEGKTALKVHKLILMSASPRFHQMFRKLRCNSFEPAVIKIEDVNPATFKMLIKNFYIGESGADITNALGLLSIATEYEADDLIAECNALMESEITNEIVLQLFQDAMQFGNKKLIISSLDHICKNAAGILKREEFQNLRLECLIEILKQDGLCVYTEMEVFDAVIKWGEAECLRQGLEPLEPKDMRLVLNKAIAYVRFPNMEQAEFALNVASKCLLDEKELISLVICFMVPQQNRSKLSAGRFISTPRTYPGDKVGPSEATLLNMLNISPFSYGLQVQQVYDSGTIFAPEILDIKPEDIRARFLAGVRNVAAVSLQIGYPTLASAPYSIVNGFKNLLAVAAVTNITFKEAETVKEFIKDPSKFASVAAAPAAGSPAKEAKKVEKKEESEEENDDMGFGLFD